MKGLKTYIVAGIVFIASAAGLVFNVPLKYAVYGMGMALPVLFITMRLGIKNDYGRAYKVYVDRSDPTKVKTVKTSGKIPEWKEK